MPMIPEIVQELEYLRANKWW